MTTYLIFSTVSWVLCLYGIVSVILQDHNAAYLENRSTTIILGGSLVMPLIFTISLYFQAAPGYLDKYLKTALLSGFGIVVLNFFFASISVSDEAYISDLHMYLALVELLWGYVHGMFTITYSISRMAD